MTKPDSAIRVCVVTFNNARNISACLTALKVAGVGLNLDIAILDNHSTDETVPRVQADFPELSLTLSSRNLGFGTAHNRLLATSDAKHALLLNPDTVVHPSCIRRLRDSLTQHRSAAVVGPRLEYTDGTPQLSFGSFPGWWIDWRQRSQANSVRSRRPRAVRRLESRLAEPFQPDWVSGACVMLDVAAFHDIGGFDEGFHLYLEDVDLCRRLSQRGRTTHLDPRAVCVHEEGGSALDAASRRRAYRTSRLRYEVQHGSRLGAAIYRMLRVNH